MGFWRGRDCAGSWRKDRGRDVSWEYRHWQFLRGGRAFRCGEFGYDCVEKFLVKEKKFEENSECSG